VPLTALDAIASRTDTSTTRLRRIALEESGARVYCNQALMSNASLRGARSFCSLPVGSATEVRAHRRDVLRLESIPLP
jgi:hypothetical protein